MVVTALPMPELDLLREQALVGGAWAGGDRWIDVEGPATWAAHRGADA